MVNIQYKSKGKPILTIADAIKDNSFYDFPGEANAIVVGDAKGCYAFMFFSQYILIMKTFTVNN